MWGILWFIMHVLYLLNLSIILILLNCCLMCDLYQIGVRVILKVWGWFLCRLRWKCNTRSGRIESKNCSARFLEGSIEVRRWLIVFMLCWLICPCFAGIIDILIWYWYYSAFLIADMLFALGCEISYMCFVLLFVFCVNWVVVFECMIVFDFLGKWGYLSISYFG